MEDSEKTQKKALTNTGKLILLITLILLIVTMTLVALYIVSKNNRSEQTSTKEKGNFILNNNSENIIEKNDEEIINLEDLEKVNEKSEEELKKLNEKELEKNKDIVKEIKSTKKNKYYIKVNYGAQVVNVYTYDKNGKYTVPVKAFICSTGTETPRSGVYKIPAKILWCKMFGDVYAHYCSQIVGNILFHSVPYLQKSNDTLEYWAYDKLGTKASMGCIRMTTIDAKWIYDNVPCGTEVEFYSSSNPGPLGKPSAQKISDAPGDLKNWDPTDPDSRNPWRNYKPEDNKNEQTNSIVTNNEISNNEVQNDVINNEIQNNEISNNVIENNVENSEIMNNEIKNNEENNQENNEENNEIQNNDVSNNKQNTNDISENTQNNEFTNTQK